MLARRIAQAGYENNNRVRKEFVEKFKEKARQGTFCDPVTYKFIERKYTVTESELNELLKEYENDN